MDLKELLGKVAGDDWMTSVFYVVSLFLILIFFLFIIFSGVKSIMAYEVVRAEWVSLGTREITVFHAISAECDSEPDIGAGGRVAIAGRPTGHWAACNFLPFGAKVMIPAISGAVIWTCRDRTAKKVGHRIDLLYPLGSPGIGVRRVEVLRLKEVAR